MLKLNLNEKARKRRHRRNLSHTKKQPSKATNDAANKALMVSSPSSDFVSESDKSFWSKLEVDGSSSDDDTDRSHVLTAQSGIGSNSSSYAGSTTAIHSSSGVYSGSSSALHSDNLIHHSRMQQQRSFLHGLALFEAATKSV